MAVSNFKIYNVQLPRLLEAEPDFNSALYCWGYTLATAHTLGKTVKEVLSMTPELQAYAETDTGFAQFCERYDRTTSDPQTRNEYHSWMMAFLREEGIKEAAMSQGHAKGHEQGRLDERLDTARSMLFDGADLHFVIKHTKISDRIARQILADLKI